MKVYRREADNFEVQSADDKPIEWAIEMYGGVFVEVAPAVANPKVKERSEILSQIAALEDGIYYSELDGDMKDEVTSWADFKKAQRIALKQQLANLGA